MNGPVARASRDASSGNSATTGHSAPAALEMSNITKRFGAFTALEGADLKVEAGSVHCLLGENGAGKSTLCNIVFGVHKPDSGQVQVNGTEFDPRGPADALSRGVAMVHQHFSLVPTLSAVENLLLGSVTWKLARESGRKQILEIANQYGMQFDPDVPVQELSIGERQRVEIVKCLARKPSLLVLDEPTAVLPPTEIEGLLNLCRRVADEGHAVLLVTHKLAEVAYVGDRATVLHRGKAVGTVPLPETPKSKLVEMMIGGEIDAVDSVAAAAIGLTDQVSTADEGSSQRSARTFGEPVFRLTDVVVKDGERQRLSGVSLSVAASEIVGIAGVEGNGQTELARVAAGFLAPDGGGVHLGTDDVTRYSAGRRAALGLAVIPEDRHAEACIEGMSIAVNIALGDLSSFRRFGIIRTKALNSHATDLMRRFDIRATGSGADMADLSGGNQQKVVLARELSRDPLVAIVAAQPTRGLDVGAVQAVLQRLREAADTGAAVLVISSELPELFTMCDRIVVMYNGSVVGEARPEEPDALARVGTLMTGANA